MSTGVPVVEVREPGVAPRRLSVTGSLEVGREASGCVLTDAKVSRRHLRLEADAAGLTVVDLGSRNGTRLNGAALEGSAVLRPGDTVRLGDTEIVVVSLAEEPGGLLVTGARGSLRVPRVEPAAADHTVEIREPDHPPRRLVVDRIIDVGRENVSEVLADPRVSRRHLRLSPEAAGLIVTDLGSRNGTLVNGSPVTGPTRLTRGDLVSLGGTTITLPPDQADRAAAALPRAAPRPAEPAEPAAAVPRAKRPVPLPVFPNYTQLRRRLPIAVWHGVRVVSVAAFLGLCVALFLRPAGGLFTFWRLVVPALPLLFFVAPGLWRNVCPLAAANQAPRLLSFTRGRSAPAWLRQRSHLIAVVLFVAIVATRKVVFNTGGPALAVLLLIVIASAFIGGVLLKGKSGWCSSVCPLLPVQRLYGQTPFVLVPNSHCQPCVGCTKNCYDFNPGVAYQADMRDADPDWSAPRKLFAGAFPGLIVAFFTIPDPPAISVPAMYLRFALYLVASVGSFFALDAIIRGPAARLAAVYGAIALNLFYWYQARPFAAALGEVTGIDLGLIAWPLRAAVLALSLVWLWRTFRTERRFLEQAADAPAVRLPLAQAHQLSQQMRRTGNVEVRFAPQDRRVAAAAGQTLLEIAEGDGLPIEAGCRMGMCGSDPVAVLEGAEHLSPIDEEEAHTLRRLGLAANTRMACSARVGGDVCVSLAPDRASDGAAGGAGAAAGQSPVAVDRSISGVVVIGNGIAGVTAADVIRRRHPDCELHLVGQEAHSLYNRMGISRLIYGRSAMVGLYLQPDDWYQERNITSWLNTRAELLDLEARQVLLGTGERLDFDRLVLAMGSSSTVPPIRGFGLPGSFVLREAADAIGIRAFVQRHRARRAVVAGGGLLGLEAAYSLHQLGLGVAVLERSQRLLRKQVDTTCSELLAGYFEDLGIQIVHQTEAVGVQGADRVELVRLKDGRAMPCDLLLVCAGIQPNVELARDAGIEAGRGVLVDEYMRTSAEGVFAAGDVAELDGQAPGLWPTAVSQAEVAAVNATGGGQRYERAAVAVILKGVGIDLTSAGRVEPVDGDEVIVAPRADRHAYGKLLLADGELVGGLLLGRPADAPRLLAAIKRRMHVGDRLASLRAGDFSVLEAPAATPAPH